MKASCWGVAMSAILIILCAGAYAEEATPTGGAPDGYIMRLNQKSAESMWRRKEERMKAAEAKKAEADEQLKLEEKKAKIAKVEGKTKRTANSWQVLNR